MTSNLLFEERILKAYNRGADHKNKVWCALVEIAQILEEMKEENWRYEDNGDKETS